MDMILFIYNILLIILYTCPLVQLISLYISKKESIYLYLSILFSLYILDNVFIYMTEFFESFASIYNLQFMTIPSIKTCLMLSITLVYFIIQKNVLKKDFKPMDYIIITLFTVSSLVIPLLLDGAMMVWSYYLPYQLVTIYLGYCGLKHLKVNTNLCDQNKFMCIYKRILALSIIFSILIIIEDTVIISSYDVYSDIMVKINNRSISEDILSMIYAVYAIKFCYNVQNPVLNQSLDSTVSNISVGLDSNDELFYVFYKFYNLTNREQEIFRLLLDDKTNQEISEELFISIGTVKTHIHNIFQKVDVTRRNQLISRYRNFNIEVTNT